MKIRHGVPLVALRSWLMGLVTVGLALAGCNGFGPRDSNTLQIDLGSIANQMADQPANSPSPQSVSGPGNTATTTDVKTIILGAIVINFQNTPLGPNTAISKNLEDSLKTAAEESVAFITLVQLPSSDSSVPVILPPPETPNWQIVAVGTQNTINQLTDVNEDSPVYYGFNVDASGNPFFISSTSPPATVNVTMQRACIAPSNPKGCAQYDPSGALIINPSLEIVGIYKNGGANLVTLNAILVHTPTQAQTATQITVPTLVGAIGPGTTVRIDATHQQYTGASAACAGAGTGAGGILGTTPGMTSGGQCVVESYITTF